ncbi:MAG: hypothetical protein JW919_03305 [Candidatus Omnitrophica bacterium]|nr:hypothetical protein [Candidatus Omnitrophota bacterium]
MLEYIKTPFKIATLIRRNPSPNEIAFGVCLAMFLGFTPLNGPMAILLMIFFLVFRINRLATLVTLPLFKIAYLAGIKGLCNGIGVALLAKAEFLTGFWAWLTNLPILALLDINYTLITGGFALAALLSPAVFFIARIAAIKITASSADKLKGTKLGAWLGAAQSTSAPGKAAKTGLPSMLRRLKVANVIVIVVALIAIQLTAGLVISPLARAFIVEKLNESTGSRLMVEGLNVWPLTLSISLKGVKVFDNKKADTRIAKLDKASFRISPIGLLSKRVVISSAGLSGAEFTPEGVKDATFAGPKGVEAAPKAAGATPFEAAAVLKTADRNKDLTGRVWQIVKKAFSKSSAEKKIAAKKSAKKVTKKVTKLDVGEKVEFVRGSGSRLLEIKSLSVSGATLHLDKTVAVSEAAVKIKGLTYDPLYGTDIGYLRVIGDVSRSGSSIGKVDLNFNKKVTSDKQAVTLAASITDLDIAAARPLYERSLSIYGINGRLTFDSRTTIDNGAMDSRNEIVLRGQNVAPRNQAEMVFGVIPAAALCEAMNSVDPLKLKFDITGTVEKPEVKGLQDSLMALAKPYLQKALQKKVAGEGQKLIDKLLNKAAPPAAPSSETAASQDSAGEKAMEALDSLFKK